MNGKEVSNASFKWGEVKSSQVKSNVNVACFALVELSFKLRFMSHIDLLQRKRTA